MFSPLLLMITLKGQSIGFQKRWTGSLEIFWINLALQEEIIVSGQTSTFKQTSF